MSKLSAIQESQSRLRCSIILVVVFLPGILNAAALKEFSAGTPILAEEMNETFEF